MDLLEFRKQRGVSLASVARTVGANPHSISQIAHDRRRPSWRLSGLIETATGGGLAGCEGQNVASAGESLDREADNKSSNTISPSLARDRTDSDGRELIDGVSSELDDEQTNDLARLTLTAERES
jgi:transcriptional regulator with XRE-family HTH domain